MIKVNPQSATWLHIKKYVDERIAGHKSRLTSTTMPWEETQMVRARISELEALLTETHAEEPTFVAEDFDLPS